MAHGVPALELPAGAAGRATDLPPRAKSDQRASLEVSLAFALHEVRYIE